MKSYFLLIIIFTLSTKVSNALVMFECGHYEIIGEIRENDLFVYRGSMSEVIFRELLTDKQKKDLSYKGALEGSPIVAQIEINSLNKYQKPSKVKLNDLRLAGAKEIVDKNTDKAVQFKNNLICEQQK